MNFRKMSSEIAKIEGKKVQVSIGNIREILKITLVLLGKDIIGEGILRDCDSPTVRQLIYYGKKKLR